MSIIFTQYLYIKSDVCIALLLSLLFKNKEQIIFWSNELEFENELIEILWKYYFDYCFAINISFWEENKDETDGKILVRKLMKLNYSTKIVQLLQEEEERGRKEDEELHDYCKYIKERNIEIIAKCDEMCLPYILSLSKASKYKQLIQQIQNKYSYINRKSLYLSCIMSSFSEVTLLIKEKDEKEDEEKKVEETEANINPRHVLKQARKYSIDEYGCLSLFIRKKREVNVTELYHNHWLYYCSFSSIWKKRLEQFGGKSNHELKKIEFDNKDIEEEFYNYFNYEPDEQVKEVEEKNNIDWLSDISWSIFYKKLKHIK
jgi:hypothetical protein